MDTSNVVAFKTSIDTNIVAKIGIVDGVPVMVVANAYKSLADFITLIIGGTVPADYDSLLKISNKISSIEAIIGQGVNDGDTLVDTVTEILTVFASYPEGVDILTTLNSKIGTADVVNDLNQTLAGKVLDARQGKAIFDLIAARALSSDLTNQIATVNATITALKAGSTETIASLNTKITTLNTIVGGTAADGDALVNTVTEILAVFATYPEGVDLLTTLAGKVNTTDIVNVLTTVSGTAGKVLDARQGKVLKDLIDAHAVTLGNKADLVAGLVPLTQIPVLTQDKLPLVDIFPNFNQRHFRDEGGAIVGITPFEQLARDIIDADFHGWTPQFGNATVIGIGIPAANLSGTVTGEAYDPSTYLGSQKRVRMVGSTAAGTRLAQRDPTARFSTKFGFRGRMRYIATDAAPIAGVRSFTGFTWDTAIMVNGEPSNFINCVGIGNDAADTVLSVFHNDGTGTATKVTLGVNFPSNTLNTDIFDISYIVLPNAAGAALRVQRISAADGSLTAEIIINIATNLPDLTVPLAHQIWRSNNATALAPGLVTMCLAFNARYI